MATFARGMGLVVHPPPPFCCCEILVMQHCFSSAENQSDCHLMCFSSPERMWFVFQLSRKPKWLPCVLQFSRKPKWFTDCRVMCVLVLHKTKVIAMWCVVGVTEINSYCHVMCVCFSFTQLTKVIAMWCIVSFIKINSYCHVMCVSVLQKTKVIAMSCCQFFRNQ